MQFVHKYGTADYAQIAEKLEKHPLLTSSTSRKSVWTPAECKTMLNDLTKRESTEIQNFNVEDRLALASLLRTLHTRCLDELKQSIKADEAEYDLLKTKQAETATTRMEVPSSTQDTAKDAHAGDDSNEGTAIALNSRADEEEEEDDDDEDAALSEVDVEDEKVEHIDNEAEEEENQEDEQQEDAAPVTTMDEDEPVEDVPTIRESKSDTKSFVDEDETPRRRKNRKKEPDTPEDVVDEIATDFHGEKSEAPGDVKMEEAKFTGGVTTRGGRTRSNTMNTVASTDTAINDDYAADQSLKKKGTRTSKRGTLREEARSPAPSSTAEDADNAATLKRFQSTILPVLNNIASHRFASVFSNPVSNKEAPNYSNVVKSPLDIKTIRAQVKSGDIPNMQTFERAVTLMLANAIMYNAEQSEVAKMAREVYEHALVRKVIVNSLQLY